MESLKKGKKESNHSVSVRTSAEKLGRKDKKEESLKKKLGKKEGENTTDLRLEDLSMSHRISVKNTIHFLEGGSTTHDYA